MVLNASSNNISVIWWRSVLLVEKHRSIRRPARNDQLYQVHLACAGFVLTTFVVIDTDCIDSC